MEMDSQLAKPITFLHDISTVNGTTMDYHLSYPNVSHGFKTFLPSRSLYNMPTFGTQIL